MCTGSNKAISRATLSMLAGKVTYGERRKTAGSNSYQGHAAEMTQSVRELYELEKQSQNSFISLRYNTPLKA